MNNNYKYKLNKQILMLFCALALLFAMLSGFAVSIPHASPNTDFKYKAEYLPVEVSLVEIESRLENNPLTGQSILSRTESGRIAQMLEKVCRFLSVAFFSARFPSVVFIFLIMFMSDDQTQKSTIQYIHNTDGMK